MKMNFIKKIFHKKKLIESIKNSLEYQNTKASYGTLYFVIHIPIYQLINNELTYEIVALFRKDILRFKYKKYIVTVAFWNDDILVHLDIKK